MVRDPVFRLFVTGAPRSGTTLVDKLLSMHDEIVVHSQPLPLLYVHVKRVFLRHIRHPLAEHPYALTDMTFANHYTIDEFASFLSEYRIDMQSCNDVLASMHGYSGQYTIPSDTAGFVANFRSCSLADFVAAYAAKALNSTKTIVGSKETICEEYVGYFLRCGAHVVLVIRDPRDSITSLSFGEARQYGGTVRPVLFSIRQWRKAIAVALEYREHPRFHLVRYEALVEDPAGTLNGILSALGVEPVGEGSRLHPLRQQTGASWLSNSSHKPRANINAQSIGTHRHMMPRAMRDLIEACCWSEMHYLGYETTIAERDIEQILSRDFPEQCAPGREHLSDYVWSVDRAFEELSRRQAFDRGCFEPRIFVFRRAFDRLKDPGCR
jgi:hypothetical protein